MKAKKRAQVRYPVRLECELVEGNVAYPALIENISKDGLFMRVAYFNDMINYPPGSKMNLKILLSSGEKLDLHCREIWSEKNTSGSLIKLSGMKIIDPPKKLRDLLRSLN